MKNKRGNTIYLVLCMLVGGAIGFVLSSSSIQPPESLVFKPSLFYDYDIIFGILALAAIVLTFSSAFCLLRMPAGHNGKEDLHAEGTTPRERAVDLLLRLSSYNIATTLVWIGLSFAYTASKEAATPGDEQFVFINLIAGAVFALVATALHFRILGHYNKLYPNRSISLSSRHGNRELFDKLDEAERYIVYRSAHQSLKTVNIMLIGGILLFIFYSLLFEFTPLPIIVLAAISFGQKAAYFRAVRKLNN